MNIIKGKTYTSSNSDLAVKVLAVYYTSSEYTKAKCILYEKKTGHFFETKSYKLVHTQIAHWYEIPNS